MKDLKILLPILLLIIWGIASCTKDDEIVNITNSVYKKELPAVVWFFVFVLPTIKKNK